MDKYELSKFFSVTVYEFCVRFLSESAVQKHKEDSLTASENFLRFRPDSESKCLDNPDDLLSAIRSSSKSLTVKVI